MKSVEIFDKGYAVPSYDINNNVRRWRFRGETVTLPANAVRIRQLEGVWFDVGLWTDVIEARDRDA